LWAGQLRDGLQGDLGRGLIVAISNYCCILGDRLEQSSAIQLLHLPGQVPGFSQLDCPAMYFSLINLFISGPASFCIYLFTDGWYA